MSAPCSKLSRTAVAHLRLFTFDSPQNWQLVDKRYSGDVQRDLRCQGAETFDNGSMADNTRWNVNECGVQHSQQEHESMYHAKVSTTDVVGAGGQLSGC